MCALSCTCVCVLSSLTGHVKSKGNTMGLLNPSTLRLGTSNEFPPSTGVVMSPKVHGDVVSILAW